MQNILPSSNEARISGTSGIVFAFAASSASMGFSVLSEGARAP